MKYLINILIIALMLTVVAVAQDEQTAPLDTSKYSAENQDLVLGYNQLNEQKLDIEKRQEHILFTIEYLSQFEALLKAEQAIKDSVQDAIAKAKEITGKSTEDPEKKKKKGK